MSFVSGERARTGSARFALLMGVAVAALAGGATAPRASPPEARLLERGLASLGAPARLQRLIDKARRGGPLVVGVIGGSITEGASASVPERRWPNLVASWWQRQFPLAQVRLVNAGIGGTGSAIGCHRAQAHLLALRPDLVVMEFAVNDDRPSLAGTFEGLVRQVLRQPQHPALLLLFVTNAAGATAQEWQAEIGAHYDLPMVSERDALGPEFREGRLAWGDVGADAVHPNDRGHELCASLVNSVFERLLVGPASGSRRKIGRLPQPLVSGVFERTALGTPGNLQPVGNTGWVVVGHLSHGFAEGWTGEEAGSVLEFELPGEALSLVYTKGRNWGPAEVSVDGTVRVRIDPSWDESDHLAWELLAQDLGPGPHRIRIRTLDAQPAFGHGHGFQVRAVLSAGRGACQPKIRLAPSARPLGHPR